jgi:signal transduction histidine kinase/ligand-binding sensor domain-containing protein
MQPRVIKILFTSIILYIAITIQFGPVMAQPTNLHFEHLTVKAGLSSDRVLDIIQDRQGFYWIATTDGLNRFDGSSFKIFRHDRNDSVSLAHNSCNTLLEGEDGDIWMATMYGVCRYRKKTGVFKNYFFHHPAMNDNILNAVHGLTKDEKGNIWAGSYGLWRINPLNDSITGFLHNQNDTTSISDASGIFNVSFDKVNNGLWMYTDLSINFFNIKTEKFYHHRYNPLEWPVFKLKDKRPLFAVAEDCFWIYDRKDELLYRFESTKSTSSSVRLTFSNAVSNFSLDADANPVFSFESVPALVYNSQLQRTEKLPQPATGSGINFSGISHRIYKDHNKNKWLCTTKGLYVIKYDANLLQSFLPGNDKSGFHDNFYSIVKEKNNLWLEAGHGLYKYELTRQKLTPVAGYENKSVRILYNAGDSLLWLSAKNEILLFNPATNRIDSKIAVTGKPYFIITDKQKNSWAGTWDNGLYQLNQKGKIINHYTHKNDRLTDSIGQGLAYNYLICGLYDGDDELWLGMNGGRGFSKLNLQSKQFENFLVSFEKKSSAEFNTITSILKEKSGNLWLGTYGGGIYYFDRKQNKFQNYQRSDGLSGDYINTLAFDSTGNLWISTVNGIDIMDTKTKNIRHVNEPMQQVNNDHVSNLAIGENGTFYYTAGNKIIAVNPRQYTTAAAEATILISDFKVLDKEEPALIADLPVALSYRQNFFSLEFSVLRVSPDIPAQYKYKLEGFNDDWIYSSTRGFANFTNVPPGNYTLLLNATNETGKWNNKPVEITFSIKPPFWKTWWFYTLSAVLIGSAILFIVKTRVRQFKKRQQEQLRLIVATQEKEKKSISAELHDDLGVRLSALKYFVTSLRKYISPDDAQAQATYNETIAIIDESVEDVRYLLINLSPKTLNEYGYLVAVEDLVNKLSRLHIINISLQQKGMEKRLRSDVEAGLYRITQELINNTLKHAGAGSIQLNIENINGVIQLQYADDGKGFNPEKGVDGYGIENIHTRVALLNGKIVWDAEINRPTKVIINIPYNHT